VDVSSAMTPTQLLLIWTLTGLLFTWMILFALLAIRPLHKKKIDFEDSSDGSFAKLHVVVRQPTEARFTHSEEPEFQAQTTSAVRRG
jgi:hypothetical protein